MNESVDQFFRRPALRRGHPKKRNKCKQSLGKFIRVVNESKTNFSSPCLSAGSLREVKQVYMKFRIISQSLMSYHQQL